MRGLISGIGIPPAKLLEVVTCERADWDPSGWTFRGCHHLNLVVFELRVPFFHAGYLALHDQLKENDGGFGDYNETNSLSSTHFIELFQKPKSGTLTVDREELETHLKKTYSDPTREIPLEKTTGLVWPAAPGRKFDSKPPSLQEVIAVVNKARAKSAPGPNGVPYLL
ncbi:reverse transcriptase [Plakobranchus ocellatus]|uniref:Reverse transcriptase n=1 Tax=Plakobranchus ocellatus TaxID=259542 RepID=A0AAV4DTD2_9GAST|nr:reverse transcriptase [Plakobranchus ocellatus]